MADSPSLFESAINWIRTGYPEGIPPTEFPPLLALLVRVLDEEDVTTVALTLAREYGVDQPVTEEQIAGAIEKVTNDEPTADEINQVAGRLAAAGWPLSAVPAGR
ncbi:MULTISPECIES: DUF3349 domain-containing protein [unclassified Gordonia (in: high G+C Gram-positive bacteria)]|uniref:DUF3349 domain-containing protein n=1 Tax=unclassified Gordonia (in: high G+C Gram-positive bacteria) TaxID=2657482 RepID=UPI001F118C0A|nr:DUF3349 domain-containing protein [Gordonia sp. ABSL49_1]MCH5643956.1 DUF3349 domain-containing protein [Gordonia sp. ABSL49_1]